MRNYNDGITKAAHDSGVILYGVLRDCMNLKEPSGFLKADQIIGLFKERMDVWARFEKEEIVK